MYIESRTEITKDQFEYLQNCNYKQLYSYIEKLTLETPFPSCGYGFESPRIITEEDKYFATWKRWDSCD